MALSKLLCSFKIRIPTLLLLIFTLIMGACSNATAAPTYSDTFLPKITSFNLSQEFKDGNVIAVMDISIKTHSNELTSISGNIGLLGHISSPLIAPCEPAFRVRVNSQELMSSKISADFSAGYTTTKYRFLLPITNTPNGGTLCRGNFQLMDLILTDEASHEISLFDFRFAPTAGGRSGVSWGQTSEVWSVSVPPCPPAEPITQYLGPVWKSACDFEVDLSQPKIDLNEETFVAAEKIKKEISAKELAEKDALLKVYAGLKIAIDKLLVRINILTTKYPSQRALLNNSRASLMFIKTVGQGTHEIGKKYYDEAHKLVSQYEILWPKISKSLYCAKNNKKIKVVDVKPSCPTGFKVVSK